jgi:non-specific serine/threonine protein kinase
VPHAQLFGREQDAATVRELVLHAPGRLVTLTGTGGCGKTQLALLVATSLIHTFADGVWLVGLAPVRSEDLVPYALAAALGRHERAGEALLDTLLTYLSARQLLLVLDNCEHLIESSASLAERVLSSCPGVRLLATSRELLHINGEATWRVPSLPGPDPRAALSPADLMAYPAVGLFVDRAQAVQPRFSLEPANATFVASVCARVEGLPLALELAAAWVPVLTMPQLVERLDDSFDLLAGGNRTAPSRQQTLRATLDWSYGSLSDQERLVFNRLAVFAPDCSLEAAEAVCAAADVATSDVMAVLRRLVDKSLVIVDQKSGRSRYRLLEPVRQYAHERLVRADELGEVRRRHAMFFLDFGERRERATNVGGPDRPTATAALLQEYPNIRLALEWCVESKEGQLGLRLARTVQYLWQARGFLSEGSGWLDRLLALPDANEPTAARAVGLLAGAYLAALLGRMRAASTLFEAGMPLARTMTDPWIQWLGPQNYGIYAQARGDLDTTTRFMWEALAIARTSDDRVDEAITLGTLGTAVLLQGDYAQARQLSEESRSLARAVHEEAAESWALLQLGRLAVLGGDQATAKLDLEQSLDIVRQQGDPRRIAMALEGLGHVALAEADYENAYARLAESTRLFDDCGTQKDIADCLESFAGLAAAESLVEASFQLAGAAAAIRETIGAVQTPFRRDLLGRWLSVVRGRVAEDVYARNWTTGRELTVQQSIALALSIYPSGTVDSQPASEAGLAMPFEQALELPLAATETPPEQTDQPPDASGKRVPELTPREQQVAALLAEGLTNRQIAERLVITERTVAAHIEHILDKLTFTSRTQIGVWASEHHLVGSRPA